MNSASQTELFFSGDSDKSHQKMNDPQRQKPAAKPSATGVEERPLADFAPIVIKAPDMDVKPTAEKKPMVELKAEIKNEPKKEFKTNMYSSTKYQKPNETKPKMSTFSSTTKPASTESSAASTGPAKIKSTVLPSNPIKSLTTTPMLQTHSSTSSTTPPPSVSDFRRNAERQSREQKAVGNVLSWMAYGLLGGIVMVAILAGFGGYTLWKMIDRQSVTVAQLETKITDEVSVLTETNKKLEEQLNATRSIVTRQQEQITKVSARADETAAQLRAYKATSDRDIADLKSRVRRSGGAFDSQR